MNYQILNVVQGTDEWKAERNKRVTASQTPILMNLNPSGYQSPLSLIVEKLTGKEEAVDSYRQVLFDKGHQAEIVARDWAESNFGIRFPAKTIISTITPDLMASLDGFNEDLRVIFEAKWSGPKKVCEVRETATIPPHHMCQVQAQLYVSGAEKCIYFITDGVSESAYMEIMPDSEMQIKILAKVVEFVETIKTIENKWGKTAYAKKRNGKRAGSSASESTSQDQGSGEGLKQSVL